MKKVLMIAVFAALVVPAAACTPPPTFIPIPCPTPVAGSTWVGTWTSTAHPPNAGDVELDNVVFNGSSVTGELTLTNSAIPPNSPFIGAVTCTAVHLDIPPKVLGAPSAQADLTLSPMGDSMSGTYNSGGNGSASIDGGLFAVTSV
jgi:hypothetical protein